MYGLGCTMYTALTGELPVGNIDTEGIPQSVRRAMQRNPDDRFADVAELKAAFLEETGFQPKREHTVPVVIAVGYKELAEEVVRKKTPAGNEQRPGRTQDGRRSDQGSPTLLEHDSSSAHSSRTSDVSRPGPDVTDTGDGLDDDAAAVIRTIAQRRARRRRLVILVLVLLAVSAVGVWKLVPHELLAPLLPQTVRTMIIPGPPPGQGERFRSPGYMPRPDWSALNSVAGPDQAAIEAVLGEFLESLSNDRTDRAYGLLAAGLRRRLNRVQFFQDFAAAPRVWAFDTIRFGRRNGHVAFVSMNLTFVDWYRKISTSMAGMTELVREDGAWRIRSLDWHVTEQP
jgi:hypothetical protein